MKKSKRQKSTTQKKQINPVSPHAEENKKKVSDTPSALSNSDEGPKLTYDNKLLNDSKQSEIVWTKQDKLNAASIIINALLFLITLFTFYQTKRSVDNSEISLKETQKQFEVFNMPYLQCNNVTVQFFEANKYPKLTYNIENFGSYPAKILDRKLGFYYYPSLSELNQDSLPTYTGSSNFYVSKEKIQLESFTSLSTLPKISYDAVMEGRLNLYFLGEINYLNEVTRKKWKLTFTVQTFPPPSNEFRVIENSNTPLN